MKAKVLLLGAGILAATMAFAQESTSGAASSSQDQNTQTTTRSTTTQENVLRGCLSGSPGNYTLTDHNGMQYEVNGDDATLRASVGREVEIRLAQHETTDASNQGSATTQTTHTVQASQVTAISKSCDSGAGSSAAPSGNNTSPSSPQLMAMLQQQEMPKSSTGTQQNQTTPPVTSQTPASQNPPTNSQVGSSPANNTGMTESEANHDAQAARQGELSTNPKTGDTTGRGVDNQGVNNPSTTNPNAVPTSPNSATPSSAQSPQSGANDQNKPLYERQATDIPWANHGGTEGTTPQMNNPPH